jgi:electron transfer flavoprotein alpha subunit
MRLLDSAGPILLESDQSSRDLAGWLSITLDAPVVWAIDALRAEDGQLEADRIVFGGEYRLVHRLACDDLVLVLGKPSLPASASDRGPHDAPIVVEQSLQLLPARVQVTKHEHADGEVIPLPGARIVVSVGRGIGGPEHVEVYQHLAEALGAALGASRVAVDSGWLPFAHQVGQTGCAVAPEVYIAFGISGAIQHLAGMRSSHRIIAINTDPEAPLCRLADLVVHADANTVARALIEELGAARQGAQDTTQEETLA